ncbi:hypothetical protein NRB18_17820, partial [Acinetobacter baumannii]|nr:hypothetical protein [Acinetobacter baumannii]
MKQSNLPFFTIENLQVFLNKTLDDFISKYEPYTGNLMAIRGILRNVEQVVENSKWPIVYNLIVEDSTGKIEVEIAKNLLVDFKNGNYIELHGVPKFNFYKEQCNKRLKAYNIYIIQEDGESDLLQKKFSTIDVLKRIRPQSHVFPNHFDLSIAVIYSSATKVNIHDDFYGHLREYIDEFNFDEIPVSLSNLDA